MIEDIDDLLNIINEGDSVEEGEWFPALKEINMIFNNHNLSEPNIDKLIDTFLALFDQNAEIKGSLAFGAIHGGKQEEWNRKWEAKFGQRLNWA